MEIIGKEKLRQQLAIWVHAVYPGVRVDFNSIDYSKTYVQNKALLRKSIKHSKPIFGVYRPIYRAIEKLVTGNSHLVFIKGSPGIAKSYTIKQTLDDMGVKYTAVNGDVTEAYLYRLLFENREGILWLQESSKLMRSVRALNLLKAATELVAQRRITKHNYSHLEVDLPTEFEYNGRLIFDYNDIPNSRFKEDFNALVSRGDFVELLLSQKQICDLMEAIATTPEEKEVITFLIKEFPFYNPSVINLRTMIKGMETYRFCKQNNLDWKKELYSEVHNQITSIQYMLFKHMGAESVRVSELKKRLILSGEIGTLRTADRKVNEWIALQQLYKQKNKDRNFLVSLTPF